MAKCKVEKIEKNDFRVMIDIDKWQISVYHLIVKDSDKNSIREVEDCIRREFLSYGFVMSEKILKIYPFLTKEMLKALRSKVRCQLRLEGFTCKKLKDYVELKKKERDGKRKVKIVIKKRKKNLKEAADM